MQSIDQFVSAMMALWRSIYTVIQPAIDVVRQTIVGDLMYEYITFVVIGLLLYRWLAPKVGAKWSFKAVIRYLFPREVYGHASTRLDYWTLPVNFVAVWLLVVTLAAILSVGVVQGWLTRSLGSSPLHVPGGWPAVALQSAIIFMTADFVIFVQHYLHHKVPVLWMIHRVHHSAEILNPITTSRVHPLEALTRTIFAGPVNAVIAGSLFYLFGLTLSPAAVSLVAGIGLIAGAIHPFRHSHVWIPFPRFVSRIFCSPAMHQIHHSALLRHRDRNFATNLSLWDWMFGTIYIPETREEFPMGISLEERGAQNPHPTIGRAMSEPFVSIWKTIRGQPAVSPLTGSKSGGGDGEGVTEAAPAGKRGPHLDLMFVGDGQ